MQRLDSPARTGGWRSQLQLLIVGRAAGLIRVGLVTLASTLLLIAAPASARQRSHVIGIALVNHDKQITRKQLRRGAAALTAQVNRDLRAWWPGPRVSVSIAANNLGARWSLVLEPWTSRPAAFSGVHGESSAGVLGVVYPGVGVPWTWSGSHELLEMLEDPSGGGSRHGLPLEICDPVEGAGYYIDGFIVSDFVTPAWFEHRSRQPWDYLSLLRGPGREFSGTGSGH